MALANYCERLKITRRENSTMRGTSTTTILRKRVVISDRLAQCPEYLGVVL